MKKKKKINNIVNYFLMSCLGFISGYSITSDAIKTDAVNVETSTIFHESNILYVASYYEDNGIYADYYSTGVLSLDIGFNTYYFDNRVYCNGFDLTFTYAFNNGAYQEDYGVECDFVVTKLYKYTFSGGASYDITYYDYHNTRLYIYGLNSFYVDVNGYNVVFYGSFNIDFMPNVSGVIVDPITEIIDIPRNNPLMVTIDASLYPQYPFDDGIWYIDYINTNAYLDGKFINFDVLAYANSVGNNYTAGYNSGYDAGQSSINTESYNKGYEDAKNYYEELDPVATTIFSGIMSIGLLPVDMFQKMFNFELFGVNISGLCFAVITLLIVISIWRIVMGGKSNGQ